MEILIFVALALFFCWAIGKAAEAGSQPLQRGIVNNMLRGIEDGKMPDERFLRRLPPDDRAEVRRAMDAYRAKQRGGAA